MSPFGLINRQLLLSFAFGLSTVACSSARQDLQHSSQKKGKDRKSFTDEDDFPVVLSSSCNKPCPALLQTTVPEHK